MSYGAKRGGVVSCGENIPRWRRASKKKISFFG